MNQRLIVRCYHKNPKIDPAGLPELYEAVCQLYASLELDEAIDRTLQAAIKLTGAERAFIQFPNQHYFYALPNMEGFLSDLQHK